VVRTIFSSVGIEVGGHQKHDVRVRDPRFYGRILRDGSMGFGESYMDGWWDSDALDETLVKLGRADVNTVMRQNWQMIPQALKARLLNMQRGDNAFDVAERHYDLGNELYSAMLDERMVYTCGYWRNSDDLASAQEAKLDLVCRKIGLCEGMSVLDLGCGWGSFAKFAAERYGAKVTGVTISKEQVELGRYRCAGLPVDIRLQDYRDVTGSYDAVISIGIMEHVGAKNYRTYVKLVDSCLAPDGVAFVHTIGGNRSRRDIEPWIHKYIFPNAVLPTISQLGAALEGIFVLEDVHNFGPDYDRTLMAWDENFRAAWPKLKARYDERFYRMWRYYLCMSAAGFRSRQLQLYQLVLTRTGTPQRDFRLS
jgi:cyclopropane-fatty-acyl-phospholipid synthase